MENQNIRIHLKAYDNKILDLSTEEIVPQNISIRFSLDHVQKQATNIPGES